MSKIRTGGGLVLLHSSIEYCSSSSIECSSNSSGEIQKQFFRCRGITVTTKESPISNSNTDLKSDGNQTASPAIEIPEIKPTRGEEFAKTAKAAKLSGAFHETAGMFKRKFGEFTDDPMMKEAGRDQQLLGKVHRFVGILRGVREDAFQKMAHTQKQTLVICIKHGGRLLDVASDFAEDMKKLLLK